MDYVCIYFSSLLEVLADHMNAEIVAGTISSKQDAMDYVTWTYFFRRLIKNPSYYHLEDTSSNAINSYLSKVVNAALHELESSSCIEIEEVNYLIMMQLISLAVDLQVSLCWQDLFSCACFLRNGFLIPTIAKYVQYSLACI